MNLNLIYHHKFIRYKNDFRLNEILEVLQVIRVLIKR